MVKIGLCAAPWKTYLGSKIFLHNENGNREGNNKNKIQQININRESNNNIKINV